MQPHTTAIQGVRLSQDSVQRLEADYTHYNAILTSATPETADDAQWLGQYERACRSLALSYDQVANQALGRTAVFRALLMAAREFHDRADEIRCRIDRLPVGGETR